MIDLAPGDRVGPYAIEDLIARGGMGVLYRASQPSLDRVVALKLIAPELAADPEFRSRFQREARLAASIDHPNVIPVFEAGESDGSLYIAMRYVPGSDLRQAIAERSVDRARALEIVASVASALDASHAAGLVHRDVKPANVLLATGSGHVYLTDFGLARSSIGSTTATRTQPGQWMGTLGYVAPEQIQGGEVDGRADVYSLGCVAFELLTGQPPFAGGDVHRLWQHVHAEAPPPSGLDPALAPFDDPIGQALNKDPGRRQDTAGDLAAALAAAARGEEPTLPPGRQERSVPTRRLPRETSRTRHRRPLLLGGAAVLLVAAGLAVGLIAGGDGGNADSTSGSESDGRFQRSAGIPTAREVYEDGGFETRRPIRWRGRETVLPEGFRVEFLSPDGDRVTVDRIDGSGAQVPEGRTTEAVPDESVNLGARPETGRRVAFTDGVCPGECVALLFRSADGDGYLVWGPTDVEDVVSLVAQRIIDAPSAT